MELSIVKQAKVAPLYKILNISTDHITGKDLTNETDFASNLKADFDKLVFSSNVKCSYIVGKIITCISLDMNGNPDSRDAGKFLDLLEKKIWRRIGWCANYFTDRNNKQDAFAIDFLFFNKSPNCCDNIQIVEEYEICTCFHCSIEDLV